PGVVDFVWAGLNASAAAQAAASTDEAWRMRNGLLSRSTTIGIGVAWLALSGASALHGYRAVTACRRATEALEARLSRPAPASPSGSLAPVRRGEGGGERAGAPS